MPHTSPASLHRYAGLGLSTALLLGGCGNNNDPEAAAQARAAEARVKATARYLDDKIQALTIELPPQVKPNSVAAATYTYWTFASREIALCMDVPELAKHSDKIDVTAVGPLVTKMLRAMPSQGVDPQAVATVAAVAQAFDQTRAIMKQADSDTDPVTVGVMAGATHSGWGVVKAIVTGINAFHNIRSLSAETENAARAARTALMTRHGFYLPPLTLSRDMQQGAGISTKNYFGLCGIPYQPAPPPK